MKIALGILGFVFLFKIGEAFLGRMSIIFYKEIGFTKSDIAMGFENTQDDVYGFQFHPESFLTNNGKILIKKILSA